MPSWTFITNHGAVLTCIAEHGSITAREIASLLGITERSVHRIIAELEIDGYVTKNRDGRNNTYEVNTELSLRHNVLSDKTVSHLLDVLLPLTKADEEAV